MKKTAIASSLILALTLALLSACGGGGGGGVTVTQPTTAVITLSTAVTGTIPVNTIITGYDVTITLPAGVTVKSTTPPQADVSVVTDYPAGASMAAVYTAATSTMPGTVRILIAKGDGYNAGAFSKVNCDIAAGYFPTASNFGQPTLDDATGIDNSDPLNPSSVSLTGELSLSASIVIN
jgi:hypothetical protein